MIVLIVLCSSVPCVHTPVFFILPEKNSHSHNRVYLRCVIVRPHDTVVFLVCFCLKKCRVILLTGWHVLLVRCMGPARPCSRPSTTWTPHAQPSPTTRVPSSSNLFRAKVRGNTCTRHMWCTTLACAEEQGQRRGGVLFDTCVCVVCACHVRSAHECVV